MPSGDADAEGPQEATAVPSDRAIDLEQHSLNCISPLACGYFSINTWCTINILSLLYGFLNIFFSPANFMQYIIHATYKIGVNPLFLLSVRFVANGSYE